MPPDSSEFLAERGLGPVERRIRLGGTFPANGIGPVPAELCLTPEGAWLVAARGRFVGRAVDLGDPALVRYELGRLRDRLIVDGVPVVVPAGRAGEVRRCIALGRLRRDGRRKAAPSLPEDRYLERVEDPARELVARLVEEPDVLIALGRLSDDGVTASALGPEVANASYLVLTADGVAVASLSELGDVAVERPEPATLRLAGSERPALLAGEKRHALAARKLPLFAEWLELAKLEPAARLHEAGRRLWVGAEKPAQRARAVELVAAAERRGHPTARLARLLMNAELSAGVVSETEAAASVAALAAEGVSEAAVDELWRRFEFSSATGRAVVRALRAQGNAEPWSLALHRAVHASAGRAPGAGRDLDLAEHELAVGRGEHARKLAETQLLRLPPDEDLVIAPERESPAHAERVRLYEVLCREAERAGGHDVRALAALCRLEPSSATRLEALARAGAPSASEHALVERARELVACLAPGGLASPSEERPAAVLEPLPKTLLDERVAHPLGRGGGRLATRLSELVASAPEPDLGFLRDFCEELSESRYRDAARALARSSVALGVTAARAYVSHGARAVGVRAFAAREPFVLIGRSHLDSEGPFALRAAELDFAIGAELAHLAFGHQRVTASEVWAGAAGKTREALAVLSMLLPVVAELGGARAARVLSKLSPEALGRALEGAQKLEQRFGSQPPSLETALGQRNEELIAAHRLVQLTADRAGLFLTSSARPALRAILLSRSDYLGVLESARTEGLVAALAQHAPRGAAYADLSLRVRALVAFYLSPDFEALSSLSRSSMP